MHTPPSDITRYHCATCGRFSDYPLGSSGSNGRDWHYTPYPNQSGTVMSRGHPARCTGEVQPVLYVRERFAKANG
jgi:hypothetical protein